MSLNKNMAMDKGKTKRLDKIKALIKEYEIETQGELAQMLRESGFKVTQGTVSRDVRELGLTKIAAASGKQKYVVPEPPNEEQSRFIRVLGDSMVSIDQAQNLIVIKTGSGMAMAVAAALDKMNFPEVVGTIAGDDTIMAAVRTSQDAALLIEKIRHMLEV